jgi:hypothetical protein
MLKNRIFAIGSLALFMLAASTTSMAAKKPNILVLWGVFVGVDENTFFIFSSDIGAVMFTFPVGGGSHYHG